MTLEEQLQRLADLGLALNPGVTAEDFLLSHSTEEYEEKPFDLVLLVFGFEIEQEPWGRYFSNCAWNFDVEAIEGDGSYVEIVEHFHRISGSSKRIEDLHDKVDIEEGHAELRYTINGEQRTFNPVVDNDWADPKVIDAVMSDLREPGYNYYAMDNGQASVWFYLTEKQARTLNALANNVFKLDRRPWWKWW